MYNVEGVDDYYDCVTINEILKFSIMITFDGHSDGLEPSQIAGMKYAELLFHQCDVDPKRIISIERRDVSLITRAYRR